MSLEEKHVRLRRADRVDHLLEISKYLGATKGLWPRIADELHACGVRMTVQGLSVLYKKWDTCNPEYRRVMGIYDYICGPGRRWLPLVSRRKYQVEGNKGIHDYGNAERPVTPERPPGVDTDAIEDGHLEKAPPRPDRAAGIDAEW